MTDTTRTVPITFPAVRVLRLHNPLLAIGRGIAASLQAYGRALELAYVAPWAGPAKRKGPALDADLQGPDPNW